MRFIAFNLCAVALLAASFLTGHALPIFASPITWLMAVVFAHGLFLSARAAFGAGSQVPVRRSADALVMLGLIGTVWGFVVALSGVDPESASDVSRVSDMVAQMVEGMGIALYTTLVGSVGALWLSVNRYVSDGR